MCSREVLGSNLHLCTATDNNFDSFNPMHMYTETFPSNTQAHVASDRFLFTVYEHLIHLTLFSAKTASLNSLTMNLQHYQLPTSME